MVVAQRGEQRREVGVVERYARRLGRGTQIGEKDVEREVAPGHRPPCQQRRAGRVGIGEHAPQGPRVTPRLARRALRARETAQQAGAAAREPGHSAQVSHRLLDEQAERAGVLGLGLGSLRLVRVVLPRARVEHGEQLNTPHTVAGRVVELEQVGRASVGEPLEQDRLPRRARPVERRHPDLLRRFERASRAVAQVQNQRLGAPVVHLLQRRGDGDFGRPQFLPVSRNAGAIAR